MIRHSYREKYNDSCKIFLIAKNEIIMNLPLGIIVTYNPLPDFFTRLNMFYTQLDQILVVDNGSDLNINNLLKQEEIQRGAAFKVIHNETNHGVAKALNQGFFWALEHGHSQVVTFDQDSHPAPEMLQTMLDVYSDHNRDGQLAVVAPKVVDTAVNIQTRYLRRRDSLLFERVSCDENVLENVTYVITSGSLYDLTAYQKLGPFRDDFFIDYVDTEYCLRAWERGYKIIVACRAQLNHRQGERQKRDLWGNDHYPTFHSPLRWYYISRNRIQMLKSYAIRFPHWLTYEIVASVYIFLRMLLFETNKIAKLWAFSRGTLDGVIGRMGKAPEIVIKKFERLNK